MGSGPSSTSHGGTVAGGNINFRSRSARPENATSNMTIANVTGGKVRLYYKAEKMALSDLIEGSQLKMGDFINIPEGTFHETPLHQDLYVTGFHVMCGVTHSCPEESPLKGMNNLLAEYAEGHPKSYILTGDKEVKIAKKGEIWVDVDGVDHNPNK